jgi:radical SAM protein with 4Fe4S-binding SPASM domain
MRSPLNVFLSVRAARGAKRAGASHCDYMPHRLIVETSSVCNLRCPMCLTSHRIEIPSGHMKLDTFQKVIDQAACHVNLVDLSHRGEPLANRSLPEMIAYADEKRVATRLSTNATVLTEELALRLISSGLDSLTFSVDGLEKETYERIRVGARFDEVVENIINFLKMKKRLRSRTPLTTIETLDLPGAPVDEEKVGRFLANFRSLPLDNFVVKRPHTWAGSVQFDRTDIRVRATLDAYQSCAFIWSTMVILWDGSVALCPQDWYNDNPLGKVHDSSLEEMWNGWTLTFVRQLLANREYNQIEVCSRCDLLWRPPTSFARCMSSSKWALRNSSPLDRIKGRLFAIKRRVRGL